jgi:hypothetical protein
MPPAAMTVIEERVRNLDSELFSFVTAQLTDWDRRALLALHAAAADICGSFAYLEVGSYLGGSLQALMRDPRCQNVISIDLRSRGTPDARDVAVVYENNSTERMIEMLRRVPDVRIEKLTTIEAATGDLAASDLPVKPDYCFVDAEHTCDVVLRDARFCAEALGGVGVIAFHDYFVVGPAVSQFVSENWRDISFALAFTGGRPHQVTGGGVFALEMGARGLLKHPAIARAIGSRWQATAWRASNRPRRTALPLLVVCATMPAVDSLVTEARLGLRQYVRSRRNPITPLSRGAPGR